MAAKTQRKIRVGESAIMDGIRSPEELAEDAQTRAVATADVVDAEVLYDPDAPRADVAVRETPDIEPQEIVTSQHPAMISLAQYLVTNMSNDKAADGAVADIIAQVLQADSVDEVLADVEALAWSSILNVPVTVYGCKWQRSEYEAGMPFYVVADGLRGDTNWRGPITIGAQTVIAQLVRLAQLNAFPVTVVLTHATKTPTRSGYMPLKLRTVQ
jgi:hypothetical protein